MAKDPCDMHAQCARDFGEIGAKLENVEAAQKDTTREIRLARQEAAAHHKGIMVCLYGDDNNDGIVPSVRQMKRRYKLGLSLVILVVGALVVGVVRLFFARYG